MNPVSKTWKGDHRVYVGICYPCKQVLFPWLHLFKLCNETLVFDHSFESYFKVLIFPVVINLYIFLLIIIIFWCFGLFMDVLECSMSWPKKSSERNTSILSEFRGYAELTDLHGISPKHFRHNEKSKSVGKFWWLTYFSCGVRSGNTSRIFLATPTLDADI